ncbi:hypothetical protein ABFS83_10G135900 [Erythranthe nasuta]
MVAKIQGRFRLFILIIVLFSGFDCYSSIDGVEKKSAHLNSTTLLFSFIMDAEPVLDLHLAGQFQHVHMPTIMRKGFTYMSASWTNYKPFSFNLWLTIFVANIFTGIVIWIVEYRWTVVPSNGTGKLKSTTKSRRFKARRK